MADEISFFSGLGTATILRRGLVSVRLADTANVDYYRTGVGLCFGFDAPNGLTVIVAS